MPSPTPPKPPTEALKPCPFCGKPSFSIGVTSSVPGMEDCGYWATGCRACDLEIHADSQEEAEARWNTRATPPARELTGDTPDTDTAANDGWSGDAICVSADFARRLERERDALRVALERAEKRLREADGKRYRLIEDADACAEALSHLPQSTE